MRINRSNMLMMPDSTNICYAKCVYSNGISVDFRMDTFSSVPRGGECDLGGIYDGSLRQMVKKSTTLSLPGMGGASSRSMFIFSEENFIRKYAKIIIEWGYPFAY